EGAGVRQRLHVGEVGGLEPSPAAGVPEEANEWADLHLAPTRLHLQLTGRPGGIGRMHIDRNPGLPMETFGEPDVVGVAVGEDQRSDVGARPAHDRAPLYQLWPRRGQAGAAHVPTG